MSLAKVRRRLPLFEGIMPSWFETNEWFDDEFFYPGKNVPAMNIKEDENQFEIDLAMPGFSKKEIEVSLEDDKLHVIAKKSMEKVEDDTPGFTRKEFSYDEFERLITLPSFVEPQKKVKAVYENGILKLMLPKKKEALISKKKLIEIA